MSDTTPDREEAERPGPQAGGGHPGAPAAPAAAGQDTAAPGPAEGEPGAEGRGADAAGPRPAEPAAPAPLGVERTPTGDARVDASLARLADADHLPTDGHIAVYEDVHQGLREALSALDARPVPPPHEHRS
ncbi:hypothetical protein AB0910_11375 [Streptomyces sp. NPDC047002]|uniref:hypothetical protein n=1 Tax=Streptomyces sp. NPDC047002 TaxID=3155475 RepID=UPI003451780D